MKVCAYSGCEKMLRRDNKSGYCTPHFKTSPGEVANRARIRKEKAVAAREATAPRCVYLNCGKSLRSDSVRRLCQEHVRATVVGAQDQCRIPECGNLLRASNRTGFCRSHHKYARHVQGRPTCIACDAVLRSDNSTGYCRKHNSQSPVQKAKRAAYYEEHRDEWSARGTAWRLNNAELKRALDRVYYQENFEQIKTRASEWNRTNLERRREISRRATVVRKARMLNLFVEEIDMDVMASRDKRVCHLCGIALTESEAPSPDHVIPLSKGGPHAYGNVATSHRLCNYQKGASMTSPNPEVERRAREAFRMFHGRDFEGGTR